MTSVERKSNLLFFVASLFCAASQAQSLQDAGSVRQQIESQRSLNLPSQVAPRITPVAPPESKPHQGMTLNVKDWRFAGNTLLSSEQLASVLTSFSGLTLDFAGLQRATDAVAQAYQDAGWVVRAYLPEQDIQNGVVTIQIVESVFGGVHTLGEVKGRVSPEVISKIFETQHKADEPLSADAINRALLLANDLPGITVTGSLRAGVQVGKTDIDLQFSDEPLVFGSVGADNTGSRTIGAFRKTANLYFNSPLNLGDFESLSLLQTQGSNYIRAETTIPLGFDGWRVGVNGSSMNYKLVAEQFAALNAGGSSTSFGVSAVYPMIRSNSRNLRLSLNADSKAFNNYSSGATTTKYKNDLFSIGLDGNSFDGFNGGGSNNFNLAVVGGTLNLNGSPNQSTDLATTQTQGHFVKARFGFSRQQAIHEDLALFGALSGQVANKNLDSSEKFYLGGSSGVRAYPLNEGGGANAQLLNLELRYRLAPGIQLTGFYDYGHVTINPNNNFANASPLNAFSLKGSGLALEWRSGFGTNAKATWSRRIGSNPNPTSTGTDQDGSLSINRFWLSVEQSF